MTLPSRDEVSSRSSAFNTAIASEEHEWEVTTNNEVEANGDPNAANGVGDGYETANQWDENQEEKIEQEEAGWNNGEPGDLENNAGDYQEEEHNDQGFDWQGQEEGGDQGQDAWGEGQGEEENQEDQQAWGQDGGQDGWGGDDQNAYDNEVLPT